MCLLESHSAPAIMSSEASPSNPARPIPKAGAIGRAALVPLEREK
jgi:hypothetical protein